MSDQDRPSDSTSSDSGEDVSGYSLGVPVPIPAPGPIPIRGEEPYGKTEDNSNPPIPRMPPGSGEGEKGEKPPVTF